MRSVKPSPASRSILMIGLAALLAAAWLAAGCDEPRVDENDIDLDDDDDGEIYPYALVIGGGLSETLSVLLVNGPDDYDLRNDVRSTGSGINQVMLYDNELYALCSLSNSSAIYSSDDLGLAREIGLGAGSNPLSLDFDEQGLAWIANFISEDVSLYDLASDSEQRELARIAIPPDLELPVDQGDEVSARPSGLAVLDGRVFVSLGNLGGDFAAAGPGAMLVIDREQRQITDVIELAGRDSVALLEDLDRGLLWAVSAGDYEQGGGFAGNGRIEALDPLTLEIVRDFAVSAAPFEMALDSAGNGWLGNAQRGLLLAYDLDSGAQMFSIDLREGNDEQGLSFVSALALAPDGLIWATEFNHDRLFALDPADGTIKARFTVNDGPETLTVVP